MGNSMRTSILRKTGWGISKYRPQAPTLHTLAEKDVPQQREDPFFRKQKEVNPSNEKLTPPFSVLSYNTLADCNLVDQGQFFYTPKWALPFSYRFENIMKELEFYDADIICLQEVDRFEEFQDKLKHFGYDGEFMGRGSRYPEGCAIFYKIKKFDAIQVEGVRLNQLVQEYAVSKKDYKKNNVAQLLVLEENNQFKRKLCIGNAHLLWDPSLEPVKVAQTHYLMHYIDGLKEKHNNKLPIILCGDFNVKPDSRSYEIITEGICKQTNKKKDVLIHTHGVPLVSANVKQHYPTNFATNFFGTLDYIFYSASDFHLVNVLEPFDNSSPPVKKYSAGPNPIMPSDHVPLLASFQLVNKR